MTQQKTDTARLAVIRKKIEAMEKEMAAIKKTVLSRPVKKKPASAR